jgi:adenylate kinase
MINILLFGPPGAGKGTQSMKIIEKYGLEHIPTGEILRSEITGKTPLGLEAKKYMDLGKLVPDETVIGMIACKLAENSGAKGFIFDGFPRNCDQAIALDEMLQEKGIPINLMIALEVDYDVLITRLLLRSQKENRSDDTREVVESRIKLYKEVTEPVIEYYKVKKKFSSVNGEGEIDDIFERIVEVIENLKH